MAAPKGHERWGGDRTGTKNKRTVAIDEFLIYLSNGGSERYFKLFMELPDKEFMEKFEDLFEYIKPKLQRSDNNTELTFKSGLKIGYGDRGKK